MRALIICWLVATGVWTIPEAALSAAGDDAVQVEPIPFKQEPAVGFDSVARVALVLLLVIGVCVVAAVLLRNQLVKRGLLSVAPSDRIAVVANRRIAPRLTVFLIHVDDQPYVMVQSGNEVQLTPHTGREQVEP